MTKANNLLGQVFNKLTVIERSGSNSKGNSLWLCLCECGNTTILPSYRLTSGTAISCGCSVSKPKISEGDVFYDLIAVEKTGKTKDRNIIWRCLCACGNYIEVSSKSLLSGTCKTCGHWKANIQIGDVFGRLTVVSQANRKNKQRQWKCLCSCGKTTTVIQWSLVSGATKSCGCLNVDSHTIHGLHGTDEYNNAVNHLQREKRKNIDIAERAIFIRTLRTFFKACVVCGMLESEHKEIYNQKLHADHVIPVTLPDGAIGEGLLPGNAVVLCLACNTRKSNRLLDDLPADMRDKILSAAEQFKQAWESGFRA